MGQEQAYFGQSLLGINKNALPKATENKSGNGALSPVKDVVDISNHHDQQQAGSCGGEGTPTNVQ
jgi:hypothetical protein